MMQALRIYLGLKLPLLIFFLNFPDQSTIRHACVLDQPLKQDELGLSVLVNNMAMSERNTCSSSVFAAIRDQVRLLSLQHVNQSRFS